MATSSAALPTHKTHSFQVSGVSFDVSAKYEFIKCIGQGAYGIVCAVRDTDSREKAAIKKITGVFDDLTDAKRTLRELRLLRHLSHENIVKVTDIIPICNKDFDDVYIVTELMDTDMYQIIRSSQPLSDDHVQYFVYQIMRALKYIHSANVIHRDLKPSNILVNENCDLKVCDFGLARLNDAEPVDMTEYVVTRWYRSPELLLYTKEYTTAIDIWSAGCILGEFLLRKAIFPGKDYRNQLQVIIETLGTPSPEEMAGLDERARRRINEMGVRKRVPFSQIFANCNPLAVDLLEKMLVFDPTKRISAAEALNHPYLAAYHDPTDEPTCHEVFQHEFETENLSKEDLRDLIFNEMCYYHTEMAAYRPNARQTFLEKVKKEKAAAAAAAAAAKNTTDSK